MWPASQRTPAETRGVFEERFLALSLVAPFPEHGFA
jgi:hypothetical protein